MSICSLPWGRRWQGVEPPESQHTRSRARPCRHPSYGRQLAEWLPPIRGYRGFPKCNARSKYRGAMAIHTSHRPRRSPKGQKMRPPLRCFPKRSWSEDECIPALFLKCGVCCGIILALYTCGGLTPQFYLHHSQPPSSISHRIL